jgi:hypothetical protein
MDVWAFIEMNKFIMNVMNDDGSVRKLVNTEGSSAAKSFKNIASKNIKS